MKRRLGCKIGDTLIEVTLAIGIFSLVAVSVISVVNASTSDAQANLETTVTREAIDAQAEALRFLQSAYVSGGDTGDSNDDFLKVWEEITALAEDPSSANTQYNITTCSDVYKNNYLLDRHAFIIDTNQLATKNKDIIIKKSNAVDGSSIFKPTATYPRLYYASTTNDTLLDSDSQTYNNSAIALSSAEGIFVVPVKGEDTQIFNGTEVKTQAAYYDFYIHTCWYNPGSDAPSTISTVIRLYDPAVIDPTSFGPSNTEPMGESATTISVTFKGDTKIVGMQACTKGKDCAINQSYVKEGYTFRGWSTSTSCGTLIKNGQTQKFNTNTTLYACLVPNKTYSVTYRANGGSGSMPARSNLLYGDTILLKANTFTAPAGYRFLYWTTNANGTGTRYLDNSKITVTNDVNLYAQWDTIYTIQGFTNALCQKYARNNYSVKDSRDNRVYTVRWANNQCWMTSDLKTRGVITAAGSNFSSPSVLNLNSGEGENHYYPNGKRSWTSPISGTSGNYNFCAAVAGSSTGCSKDKAYTNIGNNDICPANWKIPNDTDSFKAVASAISLGAKRYWTTKNRGRFYGGYEMSGETDGYEMYALTNSPSDGYSWFGDRIPLPYITDLPRAYYMYIRCVHK